MGELRCGGTGWPGSGWCYVRSADQAAQMFARLAPRAAADPAGVAEVVRLAGCLPLAVSLLARVFARHPSWTLADLAADTQAGLLAVRAEDSSIAAAFELSYRHLDALHGEGLLTETGYRRYGMHDLLRRYARDHAATDSGTSQALNRLLDYYQRAAALAQDRLARQARPGTTPAMPTIQAAGPVLADPEQALAWARAERDNLLACLDHVTRAGQHPRVVALTAALAELLRRDGPWSEAIARHAAALQSARRLGDRLSQASTLTDLGTVRRLTGDCQGATSDLEHALDLYRDLGDRPGQARPMPLPFLEPYDATRAATRTRPGT